MVTPATTATNPLLASVADQSRGSDRLGPGHQPGPSSAKRHGLSSVAGWLFVMWMLAVCGSYLYYMVRTILEAHPKTSKTSEVFGDFGSFGIGSWYSAAELRLRIGRTMGAE